MYLILTHKLFFPNEVCFSFFHEYWFLLLWRYISPFFSPFTCNKYDVYEGGRRKKYGLIYILFIIKPSELRRLHKGINVIRI